MTKKSIPRTFMQRLSTTFSTCFGIAIIALLIGWLTYAEKIKSDLINGLVEHIEKGTGWQVSLDKASIIFPSKLHIERLLLSHADKQMIELKDLRCSINLFELLKKKLVIERLAIDEVSLLGIEQPPNSIVDLEQSSNSNPIVIPWETLPGDLKISSFEIRKFYLKPLLSQLPLDLTKVIPVNPSFRLSGHLAVIPREKSFFIETFVNLTGDDDPQGIDLTKTATNLSFSAVEAIEGWKTEMRITEKEKGVFAHNLQLPMGYHYQAIFHGLTTVKDGLSGDFTVNYQADDKSTTTPHPLLNHYGCLKGTTALSSTKVVIDKVEGLIGAVHFSGSGGVDFNGIFNQTKLSLEINRSSHLFRDLKTGVSRCECEIKGSLKNPELLFNLNSDFLDFQNHYLEKISLVGGVQYSGDKLSGEIGLCAKYEDQPFDSKTTLEWDPINQVIALSGLQINGKQITAQGNLILHLASFNLSGDLNGTTDLALCNAFLEDPIVGKAAFKLQLFLDPNNDLKQAAELSLSSPKATYAGIIFEKANCLAKVYPDQNNKGSLTFSCKNIVSSFWEAEELMFDTNIENFSGKSPFNLTCKQLRSSHLNDGINNLKQLHSQGAWSYLEKTLLLEVHKLETVLLDHSLTLVDAVEFQYNKDKIFISPIFINFSHQNDVQGTLYASLDYSSELTRFVMRCEELSLDIVKGFYPDFPMQGHASVELILEEKAALTSGDIKIRLSNLDLLESSTHLPESLDATLHARLENNELQCTGALVGLDLIPLKLEGSIPVKASLSGPSFSIDTERSMNLNLSLNSRLEALLELLTASNQMQLTGDFKTMLQINGSYLQPSIYGNAELSNGSFEMVSLGGYVSNGSAYFDFANNQVNMTHLKATDQFGGIVTGTGLLNLDFKELFPYQVAIKLDQLSLNPFNYASTKTTGELYLHGNTKKTTLEGVLHADKLVINVPEQSQSYTHDIAITYMNQSDTEPLPSVYKQAPSEWSFNLNLEMIVENEATIKGRDWSSQWSGRAVLSGTTDQPLVHGELQSKQGEFKLNGKSFEITEGSILFSGDMSKKTKLYVIANRDLGEVSADIILKGSLKQPAISFRSNPPLPQREIISWILFNRGASEISSFQGTQLNESIKNLSMDNGAPDMLTQLRDRIGIDQIDIDRNETGGTSDLSLRVGKYISKGVLVSVNKSITAETNRVGIEANLTHNIKVEAQVGDDADAQLFLKWKKDY